MVHYDIVQSVKANEPVVYTIIMATS